MAASSRYVWGVNATSSNEREDVIVKQIKSYYTVLGTENNVDVDQEERSEIHSKFTHSQVTVVSATEIYRAMKM